MQVSPGFKRELEAEAKRLMKPRARERTFNKPFYFDSLDEAIANLVRALAQLEILTKTSGGADLAFPIQSLKKARHHATQARHWSKRQI